MKITWKNQKQNGIKNVKRQNKCREKDKHKIKMQ